MKKYIIFLLISVSFIACKKKQTIHISAKNAITGAPYPGLGYTITRVKTQLFSSQHKEVASGTLDENGEIYFTKRLDKNASYDIGLSQNPSNVCYSNQASFTFGDGDNFDANFKFTECAYMKQNITNVNCQDSNDYMVLYSDNQVHSLGNTPWEFHGCEGFTASHYSVIPAGAYYYEWKVTRNNITNTYYDTVYLSPGEHKIYNIDY